MNNRETGKATFVMIICALMWSFGGIFIKMISWHPFAIACFRSIIAAAILLIFIKISGRKFTINKVTLLIGVSLMGTMLCYIAANKLTTAANAIVIQYLCPVWVLLISAIFLKKKVRRIDILVVIICMAGIALFFFDKLSPGNMAGNCIAILSGICLAIMFVGNSIAADTDTQYSGLLLGHVLAAAVGSVGFAIEPFSPQMGEWIFILLLGIIQIGLPYLLFVYAARRISPLAVSLIGMLEPIANPIWVAIFYGEIPGAFALAGGLVVIVTTALWCVWQNRQPEEE